MSQSRDAVFQAFLNHTLSLDEALAFDSMDGVNTLYKGKALLHRVIEDNQLPLFKALLAHPETDINVRDQDGATPLRYILRKARVKMFDLLLTREELDLNRDVEATDAYPHGEQVVALDLGRRGTVKMVEIWVKHQGAQAWLQKGQLDKATSQRWGSWGGIWHTNELFSALDAALLQPNPDVLRYLLQHTELTPLDVSLQQPIHPAYYESQTHLPHPAQTLVEAMDNPEAVAFWRAVARDKTQTNEDRAKAILNWMEKVRLHRHLPDASSTQVKKPSKSRI